VFTRKERDLIMEQRISLATALTGGQFVVTHLDNRKLLIKINPGEVIKPGKHPMLTNNLTISNNNNNNIFFGPGDVKIIQGEGMPTYKNPFEKGNLFITFTLDFPSPNWLNSDQLASLRKVCALIWDSFFC